MRVKGKLLRLLVCVLTLGFVAGCGGGGSGGGGTAPPPPVISVTVSPADINVQTSATQQFSASSSGTNAGVSWWVNDVAGGNATWGTIGATGLYMAPDIPPSPNTVVIKATSAADSSKSGTGRATVVNPAPQLTLISPAVVAASAGDVTVSIQGAGFARQSGALAGATALVTSFVSPTQLTAVVPAALTATGNTLALTVSNPAPGGGTSTAATFTVKNPLPVLATLSSASATVGQAGFTLTLNGANFVTGSVVRWNGSDRATNFVSSAQLTATIPASDLAVASSGVSITVFNGAPAGGTSNAVAFTVGNPLPVISSLSPSGVTTGDATFTSLSVNGSDFVSGAVVQWNGVAKTTTFINSAKLTAAIPAGDIAVGAVASITVLNPTPGGGASSNAAFTISNPLPVLSSISQTSALVGSPDLLLTVSGANFVPNSLVRWNNFALPTTYVSSAQIKATVFAEDLATAGSYAVTVLNPVPGGGVSADSVAFAVNNPAPAITSLSPSSLTAGGAGFSLAVSGSNFVGSSVVQWCTGTPAVCTDRPTTFTSSTQLAAAISASGIAAAGNAKVAVVNPAPGGGTSNPLAVAIDSPVPVIRSLSPASHTAGFSDFVLTINGSNFDPNAEVLWNSNARTPSSQTSTQLTLSISAADIQSAGTVAISVQNPGPVTSSPATFTIMSSTVPTASLVLFQANNGAQVPDGQKLSPGANLSINDDHDNGTSAADNTDSVINGDADQRDMVTLALNVQPWDASSLTVHFSADNATLARVFDEAGNPVDLNAPVTIAADQFNAGALNYHAEGLAAGTATFTLTVTQGANTSTDQAAVVVGQVTSIKVTFDDGPDATDPAQAENFTKTIVDTLASSIVGSNIPATFFVQTHVPFRGGSAIGQQMIQAEAQEGSRVEVHTGNGDDVYCDPDLNNEDACDHVDHTIRVGYPAYDVNNDGIADGQNALQSDLIQAKARVQTLTGRTPVLVRPPFCDFNTNVQNAYTSVSLQMPLSPQNPLGPCSYLFDVDSGDTTACATAETVDCMQNQLTTGIQSLVDSGRTSIVVLFHDIVPMTADNMTELLKTMQKAVRYKGRNERFELLP